MKRLALAFACAFACVFACVFASAGAQAADEPAKPKAKKTQRARKPGEPKQKIWISPSDRQRLEKERAQARKKKAAEK